MCVVVACPILEELGIRNPPAGEERPRIGECLLVHLLICLFMQQVVTAVIDRAMFSYALSVRALIRSRNQTLTGQPTFPANPYLVGLW